MADHGHGPHVSVDPGCQACQRAAAAAERERCARLAASLKVTLWRPGHGPRQETSFDMVPLDALLTALGASDGA